jgi:integrase
MFILSTDTLLFPSPRGGEVMTETAVDRAVRNNRDAFGIDHRAPRDLRRSAAGLCEGPGVDRLVIRKILNYTGSDITAVYDRHGYDREKQRALNQWGKELQSIIREARA